MGANSLFGRKLEFYLNFPSDKINRAGSPSAASVEGPPRPDCPCCLPASPSSPRHVLLASQSADSRGSQCRTGRHSHPPASGGGRTRGPAEEGEDGELCPVRGGSHSLLTCSTAAFTIRVKLHVMISSLSPLLQLCLQHGGSQRTPGHVTGSRPGAGYEDWNLLLVFVAAHNRTAGSAACNYWKMILSAVLSSSPGLGLPNNLS